MESKEVKMVYKQNPETKNWLCYIPKTAQAYYVSKKKDAIDFCKKINDAIISGELYFNDKGILTKK